MIQNHPIMLSCPERVYYRSYRIEKKRLICFEVTGRAIDYDAVNAARDELYYRVEHECGILPDITVGIDDPVVVFPYVYGLYEAFVSISLHVESEVKIAV